MTSRKRNRCDLYVPLPDSPVLLRSLLDRLEATGYQTVGLTQTVYGPPKKEKDLFPDTQLRSNLRIVRRLHAVIENLSDMAYYTTTSALLDDYDLVSIAPRNQACFAEACENAKTADIITLDYAAARSQGGGLAFSIRPANVKAVMARGAVLEVPYASAILVKAQRKSLIATCATLQAASIGIPGGKCSVLLSSGPRLYEEQDVGAMALRSPEDLSNLAKTVLQFAGATANRVCNGIEALAHGEKRRFGGAIVVDVSVGDGKSSSQQPTRETDDDLKGEKTMADNSIKETDATELTGKEDTKPQVEDHDSVEDGFIAF